MADLFEDAATGEVFVVSHDPALLRELPPRDYLIPVLLGELGLEARLAGNELAENRFLLTDALAKSSAHVVGFVSARWDERFPSWPDLGSLDPLLSHIAINSQHFAAPQVTLGTARHVSRWLKVQDAEHPGMSQLLSKIVVEMNLDIASPGRRTIVMGNNFVASAAVMRDLHSFWNRAFSLIDDEYGLVLPFTYRCVHCGLVSENGVGRWTNIRHAGFFYERVTSLFFATRTDLVPVKMKNGRIVAARVDRLRRLLAQKPSILRIVSTLARRGRTCTHAWNY